MDVDNVAIEFIKYFEGYGYKNEPSASLVHKLFPMSFNMSAGMVQLDKLIRSSHKINRKISVIQKCFRHFDVGLVGDNTHLSFFEMAGAFIIGEYSREDEIKKLFNFLTKLGFKKEKIHVTVFGGGVYMGHKFIKDEESYNAWLKLLNRENVHYGGIKDNMWIQGPSNKIDFELRLCGTTTEIFYDTGKKMCKNSNCNPFCECGRFIEISNNLFITNGITKEDKIVKLQNQAFETVFGIERLVMSLNEIQNIFENKLPKLIAEKMKLNGNDLRVFTDHIIALYFLLADGAPKPGNNGRARIIRNLIRKILTILKVNDLDIGVINEVFDIVSNYYFNRYPYLKDKKLEVKKVITDHNEIYERTLIKAQNKISLWLDNNNHKDVPVQEFRLKFGIPSELSLKYVNSRS